MSSSRCSERTGPSAASSAVPGSPGQLRRNTRGGVPLRAPTGAGYSRAVDRGVPDGARASEPLPGRGCRGRAAVPGRDRPSRTCTGRSLRRTDQLSSHRQTMRRTPPIGQTLSWPLIPTGSSRWLRQVPIGAMAKRGRCVSTRKERPLDVPAHGQRVVSEGKISWPTRGPNVGQRIGSTMRSGANPGTKSACK